ncbi:MAG TPA: hypothetical protein DHW78_03410 [Ruminococcaceae bacterium]|jgi:hypothetical protein|nr:hypothetical protein [Oscillospiraceae bacterium]
MAPAADTFSLWYPLSAAGGNAASSSTISGVQFVCIIALLSGLVNESPVFSTKTFFILHCLRLEKTIS